MTQYKWTVIGAGPAGIAAVGRLLDHGLVTEKVDNTAFMTGGIDHHWLRLEERKFHTCITIRPDEPNHESLRR